MIKFGEGDFFLKGAKVTCVHKLKQPNVKPMSSGVMTREEGMTPTTDPQDDELIARLTAGKLLVDAFCLFFFPRKWAQS